MIKTHFAAYWVQLQCVAAKRQQASARRRTRDRMAHGPPTPGSAERSEVQSARWCEQGRAPAFKASSPISNHAPTDRSERQRSTDMAEAADNENRGLPERQRMEPRLQVGSRHLGLLDSVADRQPATRSCHCRQRGTGVPDFLPDRLAVRPTTRPRCRTIQTDFKGTNACTAHKACENQQES